MLNGKQQEEPPFEVNIDFDEASKAWRQNKIRFGSSFKYCCGHIKKNGKPCRAPPKCWSQQKRKRPRMLTWGKCRYHCN
jgi:hypothetical protein